MTYSIVLLGTAGSGKTTLTAAFADYLISNQMDVSIINLDPAVEVLPYKPDIDVRDIVNARTLMKEQGLGPNGALVAAIDIVALHAYELREEIESLKTNYVLIDTPGQMEIFAFRESGPLTLNTIISDMKTVALFLIDAGFVLKPSNYLSALLLASSTHFRLKLPQILVLNKVDMLDEKILEKLDEYRADPYVLAEKIVEEGLITPWSLEEISLIVEKLSVFDLVPVSSTKMYGLDELYASVQRILAGGEDYYTEEPSPRL